MNKIVLVGVALLALAGCGRKAPPADLAPPGNATGAESGPVTTTNGTGQAPIPGTQGDFVSSITSDKIYFETDSSEVDSGEDRATLQSQAAWLARYPRVRVTVEGHADERGTREYNIALGERRANATKNALAALGVAPERMSTISYGKERPDELGSDEASWARNRRAVSVTVQP